MVASSSMPQPSTTGTTSTTTTALPPQEISLRKTLISLNNSAVSLLQHGKCRCTIDTFKDALELLKPTTDLSYASVALEKAGQRISAAEQIPWRDLNVVVLSSQYDPKEAHDLLATLRTSKVVLTLKESEASLTMSLVRSMIVYNYGIAHRCCEVPEQTAMKGAHLGSFCFQIFQYAESLLPAGVTSNLLYRLVLTRNLMMLSCRLGMPLCELYKETLDPIVADILGPPELEGEPQGADAA